MTNNKKDYYVYIPSLLIDKANIDEFCKKANLEEWVAEKFKKGKLNLKDLDKMKNLRFARVKGDGIFEYSDNEFFTKNDQDKIQPSLIEPEFIEGMAKVLTLGAQKYSKDNWKKCEDRDRYKDALCATFWLT